MWKLFFLNFVLSVFFFDLIITRLEVAELNRIMENFPSSLSLSLSLALSILLFVLTRFLDISISHQSNGLKVSYWKIFIGHGIVFNFSIYKFYQFFDKTCNFFQFILTIIVIIQVFSASGVRNLMNTFFGSWNSFQLFSIIIFSGFIL